MSYDPQSIHRGAKILMSRPGAVFMIYTRPMAPGITDCALAFEKMNTTLFSTPSDANPIKFLKRGRSPTACLRAGERGGERPPGLPLLPARAKGGDADAMGGIPLNAPSSRGSAPT